MLVLGVVLAGFAGSSSGAPSCLLNTSLECPQRLDFSLNSWVSPRALPAKRFAPVGIGIAGRVSRGDAHPDALREMVLDVDKDVEVDFRGLPVCGNGGLEVRVRRPPGYLRRKCRKSIVGMGEARIEIAFAGHPLIPQSSRITAFNGGMHGGGGRLLVHAFISVPVPAAIVAMVDLTPWRQGWRAVVKVPRIIGGAGSLTSFRLNLKRFFRYRGERRSFLSAKCPDGRFVVTAPKTVFRNETNAPGVASQTVLKGSLAIPCKGKG